MVASLRVTIDIDKALQPLCALNQGAARNAWRRSLKKSSRWIISQTAKAVSKETKIPQKILKKRSLFFYKTDNTAKIWLGANPISVHHLGTPRKTRTGITVGKHQFRSAWRMTKRAPTGPVFKRTTNKSHPYKKLFFEWSEFAKTAFNKTTEQIKPKLLDTLRQEMRYEIFKLLK